MESDSEQAVDSSESLSTSQVQGSTTAEKAACAQCQAEFVVPPGMLPTIEHTADFPPHYQYAVWARLPGELPAWDPGSLLHVCYGS
jgi:hypothetical protein